MLKIRTAMEVFSISKHIKKASRQAQSQTVIKINIKVHIFIYIDINIATPIQYIHGLLVYPIKTNNAELNHLSMVYYILNMAIKSTHK